MMKPFRLKTGIREFSSFAECAREYDLQKEDLILTNEYIYRPFIESGDPGCRVVFQEKFGAGEPTDRMVDAILENLESAGYGRIVAVGGGTIIDIAKVLCVAGSGDRMDVLYDRMPDLEKRHPLILVPTTCGTGSEVTNISVISRVSKGVKQGLVSEAMYADEAALIPDMLKTLPYQVFATSSIDAMIHAVESYLSPNACPTSELFSVRALETIVRCWMKTLEAGGGDAWKAFGPDYLRASNWAGIAFGYAGCAAVHALSYPIGSIHHVPHGRSNQLMFENVMRKYQEKKPIGKLNAMEEILGRVLGVEPVFSLSRLYQVMDGIYKADSLREHAVTPEELPEFSENVLKTQQRLLNNNYVELTYEDILDIYRKAY